MNEEKDKKEKKKKKPVAWGTGDEKLVEIAIGEDISEKAKDSKRKR